MFFLPHKSLEHLTESVNSELNLVAVWFQVNRLSLILTKTNFIIFRSHKKIPGQSVKVQIDNQQIAQVGLTSGEFLGVCNAHHLTWKEHINQFSKHFYKYRNN